MKKLFDIETYQNCRVSFPEIDTLVVEGVGGHFFRVRFQKQINAWEVELHVSVSTPLIGAEWHSFLGGGQTVTDEMKAFWSALFGLYLSQSLDSREKVILAANKIIGLSR